MYQDLAPVRPSAGEPCTCQCWAQAVGEHLEKNDRDDCSWSQQPFSVFLRWRSDSDDFHRKHRWSRFPREEHSGGTLPSGKILRCVLPRETCKQPCSTWHGPSVPKAVPKTVPKTELSPCSFSLVSCLLSLCLFVSLFLCLFFLFCILILCDIASL